jgi:hypothetical protein
VIKLAGASISDKQSTNVMQPQLKYNPIETDSESQAETVEIRETKPVEDKQSAFNMTTARKS